MQTVYAMGSITAARRKGMSRKKASRTSFDDETISRLLDALVTRKLPAKKLSFADEQVRGLNVLIRYTGRAKFYIVYEDAGKTRRQLHIGETPEMDVAKARIAAKILLSTVGRIGHAKRSS